MKIRLTVYSLGHVVASLLYCFMGLSTWYIQLRETLFACLHMGGKRGDQLVVIYKHIN